MTTTKISTAPAGTSPHALIRAGAGNPRNRYSAAHPDTGWYDACPAHKLKVSGDAMRGGLPHCGNRTRMSLVCPTVVLVLPGTLGSILTRESPLYLGVCELPGISGNLPEPQNGACYGRCAVSATGRIGLARSPRSPSCLAVDRFGPCPCRPTGTGSTEAAIAEATRTSRSLCETPGRSRLAPRCHS